MDRRTVELSVAGQKYRVVSSVEEAELQRLAAVISKKLDQLMPPGRVATSQTLLLAAMALAHDVETERGLRESLEVRTRDVLGRMLVRIDEALGLCDTEKAGGS